MTSKSSRQVQVTKMDPTLYEDSGRYPSPQPEEYIFVGEDTADADLAVMLGVDKFDLYSSGVGLRWNRVWSRGLVDSRAWFVNGDPWSVLIGINEHDILVANPEPHTWGYLGPENVLALQPSSAVAVSDPDRIVKLHRRVVRACNRTYERLEWCPLCRRLNYFACPCTGDVLGVIYD